MKTKISRIGKKSLSVVIALMMIVSTMLVGMVSVNAFTVSTAQTIYFKPSSDWSSSSYFGLRVKWGSEESSENFYMMSLASGETDIYTVEFPAGTPNGFQFVKFKSNSATRANVDSEGWDSYQTSLDTSKNLYTMGKGWSVYSSGSGETTDYYYSYNDGSNKFVKMEPDSKHGGYVIRVNKTNGYLNADKKFKIADVDNDSDGKLNNGTHCVNYNIDISTVEKSTSLTSVYFEFDKDWQDLYIKGTSPDDLYIQYTPDGTNGLAGKIKVWSVTDYLGTTDPTDPTEPTTTEPVETTVPPTTAPAELEGVTLTANSYEVRVGDSITLTATVAPSDLSGVTYKFYKSYDSTVSDDDTNLASSGSAVTVTEESTPGSYYYYVVATVGLKEVKSDVISVKVKPLSITGVKLISSTLSVNVNEEFTLTATAFPAGVTDVTYTFYKDSDVIAEGVTSNTYTTSLSTECEAVFTVEAKANGNTVKSNSVTVTASAVAQTHNLTVYFKCASAPAYKPYVSLDGDTAVEMTQGTELGKNYAGTLTFYWYSYTFNNVNSANTHTLKFTSKKTKLNATITDNFANSEYYLAVDNLMTGTEVVDLTGSLVYVRNFFHSATNLVYSGVGTDGTLGFTNINGTRYKMGTYIDDNGLPTFSIKSATTMQMLTAELTTVSETQQAILDVNLDGKVDIKDATLMQRALVS